MKSVMARFRLTKADWITAGLIALFLPTYYKLKYIIEGEITWRDFLSPDLWVEYLFSSLLALGLILMNSLLNTLGRGRYVSIGFASAIAAATFTWFYYTIVFPFGAQGNFLFDVAVLALLTPLLIAGVRDRLILTEKVDIEKLRASEAEKAALEARYETLKSRLSPHFLFNGLNTLTDIVEDEPSLAIQFIDNLAAVYRYLIERQDAERAPLRDELAAVSSLLFILQTRHPDAFNVALPTSAEIEDLEIVPLTLQMLLENALKHNIYSKDAPLNITVTIEGDELLVENSSNPNRNAVSFKTGLTTLKQRIALVTDRPFSFGERPGIFWARAPILEAEAR
ncbi:sensor histidine kinase [Parasphingopyxis lamellibrachiae]|uniref:Histidine kinase n=1 Tax=Parasphingopyxis lamellibrachiae TaxID=680125 RepID=A0A3D9FHX8_9SPHN|nr:histidine kinase [Parasphingopyxis lamellibrachiae]RED16711.1 histidine kinase [Parasphingopyxis lamellibrachiae]